MDKGLKLRTQSTFKIMKILYVVPKMYFFILDMSSDSEKENETNLSLDELKTWKVAELKEWLTKRGGKNGNKDILINRIYRGVGGERLSRF